MKSHELPDYLNERPFAEILSESIFTNLPEVTASIEDSRRQIKDRYPDFNFEGLNNDSILRMRSHIAVLDRLSREAVDLARSEGTKEAHILAREVKLISDPNISVVNTPILQAIELAGNDVDMALSFMGLRDVENAGSWVDFITRTWGSR